MCSPGVRSTPTLPSTRRCGRCVSSGTTRAAGARTATRRTGRRSRTAALPTTARAALPRGSVQGAGWQLLGAAVVAAEPAAARLRRLEAVADRLRAPPLSLERRPAEARGARPLGLRRPLAGAVRRLTYAGNPVHGFGSTRGATPRPLRPQRLHRHVQLRLRRRLAAGVRHPRPQAARDVLPQLRAAEAVPRLSKPGAAARRPRREIPRHGDGPRCDAGRRLGGPRPHSRRPRLRALDLAVFDELMAGDARCAHER